MRASFDKRRAVLLQDYKFFAFSRVVVKPRIKRKRSGK